MKSVLDDRDAKQLCFEQELTAVSRFIIVWLEEMHYGEYRSETVLRKLCRERKGFRGRPLEEMAPHFNPDRAIDEITSEFLSAYKAIAVDLQE